jgi:NAD(P)-dependent dehydrogenase (short-subunit alcohol dehydrogenase family)
LFDRRKRQSEGDIARPEAAERVSNDAFKRFGRIDALAKNTGVFIAKITIVARAAGPEMGR